MVFDIGGALYGLCGLAGLIQNGVAPSAVTAYLSAAAATALGAWTGTTPLIIAAESAVGGVPCPHLITYVVSQSLSGACHGPMVPPWYYHRECSGWRAVTALVTVCLHSSKQCT